MKLWTNISSLLMNIHEHSSEPRKCGQLFHVFVYNFMFLSTFSKKLYEHFWVHLNIHK
jgi:hypothetical protein